MKKLAVVLFAVTLLGLLAAPCFAGEGFYAKTLRFSQEISVGNFIIKVHARRPLDTSALLEGISDKDEFVGLQGKIDTNRQRLFPEKEIAVELTDTTVKANDLSRAPGVLTCFQQILWWNNSNPLGTYWVAKYNANVATMFTQVLSGSYRLRRYMNGAWATLSASTNGTSAWWIAGSYSLMGYKGFGLLSSNKAHVVMFFFQ